MSESNLSARRRLQPLVCPFDRHFEQYLIDYHHFPKLPSINRQRSFHADQIVIDDQTVPQITNFNTLGPISRLLNSDEYRQAQARLIEYRQRSQIPGVALNSKIDLHPVNEPREQNIKIPIKDIRVETNRENEFFDDDSVISNESDRRQRAKQWIKEHQFFFTEYK